MTPSSETVQYDAGKLAGLRRKGSRVANWMAGAVEPKRRGVFKRKAAAAGMSTAAYAAKEKGAPGALGKEARLAQTFAKFRPKKKGALKDHVLGMRRSGYAGT